MEPRGSRPTHAVFAFYPREGKYSLTLFEGDEQEMLEVAEGL